MYYLVFIIWLISQPLLALNILEIEKRFDKKSEINDNNFQLQIGANFINYPKTYNFESEKSFQPSEEWLIGPQLTLAYEIFLGSALSTTTKASYFYLESKDNEIIQAAEDLKIDIIRTEERSRLNGYEVSQSLNYLIETSLLFIQPFLEVGFGKAQSKNTLEYSYNDYTDINEAYESQVEEDMTYARLAIGLNLIGRNGVFSYLQVSQTNFSIDSKESRSVSGSTSSLPLITDSTPVVSSSGNSFSEIIYGLGMGYRFEKTLFSFFIFNFVHVQ